MAKSAIIVGESLEASLSFMGVDVFVGAAKLAAPAICSGERLVDGISLQVLRIWGTSGVG